MNECRGCRSSELTRVLDLGDVPVADYFPLVTDAVSSDEAKHHLAMDLCSRCGLAQLADDDTVAEEPRGVEPQALKDQAADAVGQIDSTGWLRGKTVREFGSPHGGTWLPMLAARGFTVADDAVADVTLDTFGIMHEPDQRAAFHARAAATARDGVLLVHFHSLATIVTLGQWNMLRHGHFGYYSLTSIQTLLATAGMSVAKAWEFPLYGGTVLVAATHERPRQPDGTVTRILANEQALGVVGVDALRTLQQAADEQSMTLRSWLERCAAAATKVYAYGAASRAVTLFTRAGAHSGLIRGVADAAVAKHGRRMPGTDIPIISPEYLVGAQPDLVLLTLPDLLSEVSDRYPALDDRWVIDYA